jgi:tRNA (cytosine38-C5)-methyltransferase
LDSQHYTYQEYLLSPYQFGIPNSRLRYFLIANCLEAEGDDLREFPKIDHLHDVAELGLSSDACTTNLQEYLEEPSCIAADLYLKENLLWSHGYVLDIVQPSSTSSCCFTKSYYNYMKGTGSVLQTDGFDQTEMCLSDFNSLYRLSQIKSTCPLSPLCLRYFTPREIARLHGFPETFQFPSYVTRKQRYRLLGNSLNIQIVVHLLHHFILNPKQIHLKNEIF